MVAPDAPMLSGMHLLISAKCMASASDGRVLCCRLIVQTYDTTVSGLTTLYLGDYEAGCLRAPPFRLLPHQIMVEPQRVLMSLNKLRRLYKK